MAGLGNQFVDESYKDVVQLEQSGAGLPSAVGENARLYDGDGNPIIFRTARPHTLDVCPVAAAKGLDGTFEWETDMTKAQLETAGWTFNSNIQFAFTKNGLLYLYSTQNAATPGTVYAEYTFGTALTGEFYLDMQWGGHATYVPGYPDGGDISNGPARYQHKSFMLVTTEDHAVGPGKNATTVSFRSDADWITYRPTTDVGYDGVNGTPIPPSGWTASNIEQDMPKICIARYNGSVYLGVGGSTASLTCRGDGEYYPNAQSGWEASGNTADTRTYDKMVLWNHTGYAGWQAFGPIRRYV